MKKETFIVYIVTRELAFDPPTYNHEYRCKQKYVAKVFSSEQQAQKFIDDNNSKMYHYTYEQYTVEKEI